MWPIVPFFIILHSALSDVENRSNLLQAKIDNRIDPLVQAKVGLIKGLSENGYSKFLGIPYGVVDEGNPFAPSFPHPNFNGTFNAYDGSVICPQATEQGKAIGHIQCLNLNVYVPESLTPKKGFPVMVYIHGGAFIGGSGTNPIGAPTYFLEKDVIFVGINYRLGVYGFICTDSPKAPGNIGLRDQYLALKWINDNIGSFGGNNRKITLFGESAGAMSIHLHLLSNNEIMFDRAIIQSGAAISPWALVDVDNYYPLKLAEKLGLRAEDIDEAIDFIAKADIDLLIEVSDKLKSTSQYSTEPLTKACVEKEFEDIKGFITENPNTLQTTKVKTIPVMIGVASQELIFRHRVEGPKFFDDYSFQDTLESGFNVNDELENDIRHFYIGDEASSKKLENEITSFASDFLFNHPTERTIDFLLENDAKAVFYYVFSYVGERSSVKSMNTRITGSSHGDDIRYLFDVDFGNNISDDDQLMIERMTTMWTNFAKYGDPTPRLTDVLPVKWQQVSKDARFYLNIDKELTLETRPFRDRMAFWDLAYRVYLNETKWNEDKI